INFQSHQIPEETNPEYLAQRSKFIADLRAVLNKQLDPIQMATDWVKYPMQDIIAWLFYVLTDIIKLKLTGLPNSITNTDNIDFLQKVANKTNLTAAYQYYDELIQTQKNLRLSNPNLQMVLEDLFYKWVGCVNV